MAGTYLEPSVIPGMPLDNADLHDAASPTPCGPPRGLWAAEMEMKAQVGSLRGLGSGSTQIRGRWQGSGHEEEEARGTELLRSRPALAGRTGRYGGESPTESSCWPGGRGWEGVTITVTLTAVGSTSRAPEPCVTQKTIPAHGPASPVTREYTCAHTPTPPRDGRQTLLMGESGRPTWRGSAPPRPPYQLLFQVWRTSASWIWCWSACSSRKSNMYLMARGRAEPRCAVLKMVSNRSSTNFCSVPCGGDQVQTQLARP